MSAAPEGFGGSPLSVHWSLDPAIAFLNHGSFGACPIPVLERQTELRARMEREPVRFFVEELDRQMVDVRKRLARFVGASPEDVALIPNATAGINAVLRSLEIDAGDEIIVTDHEYQACRNAVDFVTRRAGARTIVATVPYPTPSPETVIDAIMDKVSERTRLVLIDHVTSQTGMIWPVEELVRLLSLRGVDTLVDGAHGPGMVPVQLNELGAAYYVANCHKWLCTPKGAGFLHVRRNRQIRIRPLAISHGASWSHPTRSRYRMEFDWTGTADPTPFLCIPAALDFMEDLVPGGWTEIRHRNRELVLHGRRLLCHALQIEAPCPESMIGSLASLPLPDATGEPPASFLYSDPLHDTLLEEHKIQVPIVPWPAPPHRLLRISAQLYNDASQYEKLASVLPGLLAD